MTHTQNIVEDPTATVFTTSAGSEHISVWEAEFRNSTLVGKMMGLEGLG
jgi:hypothetical protein